MAATKTDLRKSPPARWMGQRTSFTHLFARDGAGWSDHSRTACGRKASCVSDATALAKWVTCPLCAARVTP